MEHVAQVVDPFVFRLSIFVLAVFVGYFVVWSVTPALHTPLMSVTNAISSVIVVGALIAASVSITDPPRHVEVAVDWKGNTYVNGKVVAPPEKPLSGQELFDKVKEIERSADNKIAIQQAWISKLLGFVALCLASVNIFGGFLVTQRMLSMYKKKEKPPSSSAAVGQKKT